MKESNILSKEQNELNEIKSKNILLRLKGENLLQKLFGNLLKKRALDIIKYNKYIKERINININNYKEYSEIYSSIELEIKPVDNKYGKFINIDKENEIYYHIYFNNNKEEIKRNYLNENEKIDTIKIVIDYQVKSFEKLFYFCECVKFIYFKKFCRNNINDMNSMFFGCSALNELNLSNFNTKQVTNMNNMFYECSSLKELNVSNFNTNNVTTMEYMFYACSSLKKLNLSNFNTDNVTNMNGMFCKCSSLKDLNISNFDTKKSDLYETYVL